MLSAVCEEVAVLYAGCVAEHGPTRQVLADPRHPYTRALLDAIPDIDDEVATRKLAAIPGAVPGLGEFPPGCPFRNRCPRAHEVCARMPALEGEPHPAACWFPLV